MKFKQKYHELRQSKKDAEVQRNSYFTILADNQKLRQRMKKQRNSSLAPLPKPGQNVFKSARHSSQVGPSKKYNQYMAPNNEYSSANNGFHSKKKSLPTGKPPSEADAQSAKGNGLSFADRMSNAVMGKYFLKDQDQVKMLRQNKLILVDKKIEDL